MSNRNRINTTLNEYANAIGLGNLCLDSNSKTLIEFDAIPFVFEFDEQQDLLWVRMELGLISNDNETAYEYLLELGLMTWIKDIFTLSLTGQRKVTATTCIPAHNIDLPNFEALIAKLFSIAKPIRDEIAQENFQPAFLVKPSTASAATNEISATRI